jgi:hypothetical protein
LSADAAFLALCAVTRRDDWRGRGKALDALDEAAWRRIAAHARHHGFAGLVSRNLDWACEGTGLSVPVAGDLRAVRRQVLAQNLARKAAARCMGEALERRGIAFIALKGVALAEEVYGDLSLRGFNDFDVMVPLDAVEDAFQIALDLGYVPTSLGHVREHLEYGAHAVDMAHRDGMGLDLHWSIAPRLPASAAEIVWKTCVRAPQGSGLGGLRLSPELSLIHLAMHFHSHQYKLLKPMVDFYFTARSATTIDSGLLSDAARRLKLARVVDIATVLAERCFGEGSLAPLLDGRKPDWRARVAARVVSERMLVDAAQRPRLENWLRYLLAAGGPGFAAQGAIDALVPGKLVVAKYFRAPFRPGLYPRYYWRQLLKALTLSNK